MESELAQIVELQDAYNQRVADLSPEERGALARRELIHIGAVEPEMAWVLDALSVD